VLAFFVGRITAPEGTAPERLRAVEAQLDDARQEAAALEAELDEAEAAAEEARAEAEAAEEAADTAPPEEDAVEPVVGDTYVVQGGDTLQSIAEDFYEDPSLADVIAEANDITDPAMLSPGTELIIPERPEL
jgi:nucleoid-associated protein YgaU